MGYRKAPMYRDTWLILDEFNEAMYLILRDDHAYLIDTGMGYENLADYVSQFTDLEPEVIITHGHGDHIGRTGDFETVYMDSRDAETYANEPADRQMKIMDLSLVMEMPSSFGSLRIIPCPGHTPGSVIVADPLNKAVYTGDAVGSGCGVWMQVPEALSMSEYRASLLNAIRELEDLGADGTWRFYGGHFGQDRQSIVSRYNPLTLQLMKDMADLCERLITKEARLQGTEARAFDEPAYYTSYGTAEMIVTKSRLH